MAGAPAPGPPVTLSTSPTVQVHAKDKGPAKFGSLPPCGCLPFHWFLQLLVAGFVTQSWSSRFPSRLCVEILGQT